MFFNNLNPETFHKLFFDIKGKEILAFMQDANVQGYRYWLDPTPDVLVLALCSNYELDVNELTKVIIECFMPIGICRQESVANQKYMTIVDCLDAEIQKLGKNSMKRKLIYRLTKVSTKLKMQGMYLAKFHHKKNLHREMIADYQYLAYEF